MPESQDNKNDSQILHAIERLSDNFEKSNAAATDRFQHIILAQTQLAEDVKRVGADMTNIKRIVTGADGVNGLASEVRELKRDIQELKAEDERLSQKIDELANSEKEKTKIIFDWGWKILVFLAGLMFSVLGAIKAFKEMFKV